MFWLTLYIFYLKFCFLKMSSSSEQYSESDTDADMLAALPVRSRAKRKICLPERLKESSIELEATDLSSDEFTQISSSIYIYI